MQVILEGTLTGVQGGIRSKVFGVLERDTSLPETNRVIFAETLTGVQDDIRCKVLAVLERDTSVPESNQVFFDGNAHRGTR